MRQKKETMKTSRIKIMSTKPEVSDEELRKYMNFDELLDRRKAADQKIKNLDLIWKGGILSAVVITLSIVWFIYRGGTGEEQVVPESTQERGVSEREPASPIDVRDSAQSKSQIDLPLPAPSAANEKKTEAEQEEEPDAQPDDRTNSQSIKDNGAGEYQYSEAEPLDGFPSLYEYFNDELVYPGEAIGDSIQGVMTASFVIGVTGTPENVRIENSLGEAFDEEVRRLIENMPAWKPATVNGKPVPSRLSIPVTFRLQKVSIK